MFCILDLYLPEASNVPTVTLPRRTALQCAAYSGFLECVQILLEAGAEVNLQDDEGITALHWAASAGHLATVSLLLNSGMWKSYFCKVDNCMM